MKNKLKDLIELFYVFLLIGTLNFGGGYSVLPFFQKEIVQKRKWVSEDELLNYYVLGQCLPGLIAINASTFIGHKKQRTLGAIFATAGMVTPAIISVLIVTIFIYNFIHLTIVQNAILGINAAVILLIFDALFHFLKKSVRDKSTLFIFLLAFLLSFKISPAFIIFGAGLFGFSIKKIRGEI